VAPGLLREAIIDVFEPGRRLRLIFLTPPGLEGFDGAVVEDTLLDQEGEETIVRTLCSGVPDTKEWTAHYMKLRGVTERNMTRLKILVEQRERMVAANRSKK
jgi:hypothetical protein